jgi:3',5'-cyclic AMP phosphodiesterase CpdA
MNRFALTYFLFALLTTTTVADAQRSATLSPEAPPSVKLPLKEGSVRFAVIGDNGTGQRAEFEVADQMERFRRVVKFDFVTMNGDNIYGRHRASDFREKFEHPYKSLLDANVKFYASLGNHDDPDIERNYKLYNMGGDRYYSFKKGNVEFFALDSNYMDPRQLTWIEDKLKTSNAAWKICFFHHPLFTSAKFHGPDLDLRKQLMPLFIKYKVNLVLSGHEHVYERLKPQNGLHFFVLGNSGELRFHNLRKNSDIDEVGFDTDRDFMLIEISGDQLYFETISRTGDVIDSGTINRVIQQTPSR